MNILYPRAALKPFGFLRLGGSIFPLKLKLCKKSKGLPIAAFEVKPLHVRILGKEEL
jgi:hypothetical protein